MQHRYIQVLFATLLWCGLLCAPQLAFAADNADAGADKLSGEGVPNAVTAPDPATPDGGAHAGESPAEGDAAAAAGSPASLIDAETADDEPSASPGPVSDGEPSAPDVTAPEADGSDLGATEQVHEVPAETDAAGAGKGDPATTVASENAKKASTSAVKSTASAKTAVAAQDTAPVAEKKAPSVSYRAYSQGVGWQATVTSGVAGITGKSRRLESLKVTVNLGDYKGGLQMQARVQNVGWQKVLENGRIMGVRHKSQSIRALRMILTGELSRYYDIEYRAHVQDIGWQEWVRNGDLAGTADDPLRVEAVEIRLVQKEVPAAEESAGIVGLRYQAYVQRLGWQEVKAAGFDAGTIGRSLRIEALRVWFDLGTKLKGNVKYRAYVQNKGWMRWVKNGARTGTIGKSLRVEALQVRLTGNLKKVYDLEYTAHVQNVGWQYKRYNGKTAGTRGQSLRVEALNMNVVAKDSWSGWYGSGKNWQYKRKGKVLKGRWLLTEESPIAVNPGLRRYWLDSKGKLAVSRFIEPGKARDKGSWRAYATSDGFVFRDGLTKLAGKWYFANSKGKLSRVGNIGDRVAAYVNWAVRMANDDSHGYSQINRWGPDYDCSSLVIAALKYAGFNVGDAVYTGNMVSELTQHGFTYRTDLNNLRTGDILWVHNGYSQHTEIYVGGGRLVGATSSEDGGIRGQVGDQTGREIRVGNYYNMPWAGYLRIS